MEPQDLMTLWRRCVERGTDDDWRVLLERLEPRLRRTVGRQLAELGARVDPDHVDEAVQDVYCRLLAKERRALQQCRASNVPELLAYLKQTVRSVVIDRIRVMCASKRGRGKQIALDGIASDLRATGVSWCPEARYLVAEGRKRMTRLCLDSTSKPELARRNVWIVQRAFFDGWSCPEIASSVGMKTSSVQSVLHRFWTRFRALLETESGAMSVSTDLVEKTGLP